MAYENLLFEARDGVGVITMNRPKALNALNGRTIAELDACLAEVAQDPAVRALVVTGAGDKAFVAGADIGMLGRQGVLDGRQNSRTGQALMQRIEDAPQPVLAAINGYALGGGLELALACDLRFCASTARLGLPEVSLGIIPGYGGTQRLPRLCGSGVALQLILSAMGKSIL